MSRTTVRAAIQTYLQSSNVTFVGTVFQHPPKVTSEGLIFAEAVPGTGTAAVIYIHLQQQAQHREALVGPTAIAGLLRIYQVDLICRVHSRKRTTEQVGEDNDAFLDSLVLAIEANRTAADPAAVWQWGEGTATGSPDVKVTAGLPEPANLGAVKVESLVTVTAVEWPGP